MVNVDQPYDDATTIELLREIEPDTLTLPGGRPLIRAVWERHRQQDREYVFVATVPSEDRRTVLGNLELRVIPSATTPQHRIGTIDRLYVLPAHRRRGLGNALLQAALNFGRSRGLQRLREHIPKILRRHESTAGWYPRVLDDEEWGGVQSLGATASACAARRQPCAITGVTRSSREGRMSVGAYLEMPLSSPAKSLVPNCRVSDDNEQLRLLLLGDVVNAINTASTSPPSGGSCGMGPFHTTPT